MEERFVNRIIAAFPAASSPVTPRVAKPSPIFICGMFRSGSTLIEQLLGRHERVTAGGELDFIPRAAAGALAPFPESMASMPADHLAALAKPAISTGSSQLFPGAEFVTDKRPDNFVFIGLIKKLFPGAKIVHTTRNALDNCLSIFFLHLDHRMGYALDPLDIAHHYKLYSRMMAHWKRLYGPDIIDIGYDEFVREPREVGRQLFSFLGLQWNDRCLAPTPEGEAVRTASVWQVREPIYQRSSGRAENYEKELLQLREYLSRV
jgi:hypothetical protein